MIEEAFYSWYRKYNPNLEPELDDALDELRDCFYTAWYKSREIYKAMDELANLGQEFDNE